MMSGSVKSNGRSNSKLRALLDNIGSVPKNSEPVPMKASAADILSSKVNSSKPPQRLIYSSHQQKMRDMRQNRSPIGPQGMNEDIQHLQAKCAELEAKIAISDTPTKPPSESGHIKRKKDMMKAKLTSLNDSFSKRDRPSEGNHGQDSDKEITLNNIEIDEI